MFFAFSVGDRTDIVFPFFNLANTSHTKIKDLKERLQEYDKFKDKENS